MQSKNSLSAMYRILYVDDEPSLLEIGKLFLEQSGDFTVTTALSGPEAIRMLEKEKSDAVISDYQMPGMDGIQLLTEVRKQFGLIPFILFTGRGREEVVIQAINSGADFYLQKGGEPEAQFAELSHKTLTAIEHHRASEKIQSLNRLYSVLSATNRTIFHIRTKSGFFSEICRILVETGGFRMVWIGLADPDNAIIRPVASAGHVDGYLDTLNISTEDIPRGRGPTGTAYREGKYYFSNDITRDPNMEPWRENALKRGYLANAAFPFALGTKNAGVISLYAPVTGFFGEDIVVLINELTDDIAVSLRMIDDQNDREQAEESLKKSEVQLTRAEAIGRSGSWEFRLNENEVSVSKGAQILYGLKGTKWTIAEIQKIPLPEYRPLLDAALRELIAGNAPYDVEFRIQRPSDDAVLDIHSLAEFDPQRNAVFGVIHDITGQKRIEEALRESEGRFREQYQNNPLATFIWQHREGDFFLIDCNKAANILTRGRSNDFIGKTASEMYAKRPEIIAEIRQSFSEQTVHLMDLVSEHFLPGKLVHTTAAFVPPDLIMVHMEDITERRRVEEALKESEEKFRKIFESSAFGMTLALPDFRFLLVNPAWVAMLGYTEDELRKMSFKDVTYPGDISNDIEGIRALGAGTIPVYRTEKRYVRKDGSILWGSINVTTIRNLQGDLLYYLAQIEDITPRKKTEDALRDSEEKLALVMNGVPTLIAYMDTELRFVYMNKAHRVWYGCTEEELVGKSLKDLLPDEIFLRAKPYYQQVLSGQDVVFENPTRDRQGRKRVLSAHLVPHIRNEQVVGFFAALEDITDSKQTEEALKQSQIQLAEALDLAHVVNWEFDTASGVFTFDDRFYALYGTTAELEGGYRMPADVYARKFVHPDDMNMVADEVKKAIQTTDPGYMAQAEHRIIRRDGEIRHIVVRFGITKDENGRTVKTHGANQDITERMLAEEANRQANKKLNLLTSITRHDINNQLTVLMGYLRMLEKRQPDPSLREYFGSISTAAQRISSIIQFTREYAAIGVAAPVWQDCRIIVDTAAKEAPLESVLVKNDLPVGAEVFADPLIVKVLYNLMDNAVRYGGKITTIRFSAQESGEDYILVCEDDGVGIPVKEKEQIFKRGFGKNTGLGLALSREILDITGITIHETGIPGKGARFEMKVPKGAYRFADP